jgi:hypothetical protein
LPKAPAIRAGAADPAADKRVDGPPAGDQACGRWFWQHPA